MKLPVITIEKGVPLTTNRRGGRQSVMPRLVEQIKLMEPGDSFLLEIETTYVSTLMRKAFKKAGYQCSILVMEKPQPGNRPGKMRVWRV